MEDIERKYDNWEQEEHTITNREYYDLKRQIDNITISLKFLLFVLGILTGMVLINLK